MPNESRRKSRLRALCVLGFAALNYPLLAIFDGAAAAFGMPGLAAWLFAAWGGLIALAAAADR